MSPRFFRVTPGVESCSLDLFFFLSGFSFTDSDESRTAVEGIGLFFMPLYHFLSPTNIQAFICNFAYDMTVTCFLIVWLVFTTMLLNEIHRLME